MNERKDIELKKAFSKFKKDSKIKECFHFDLEKCSDQIILAHSIQRSGVLTLLEEEVEGNLAVYSFLNFDFDRSGKIIGFEPLGKKSASTFSGFCGHHDTTIFQSIENNPVDIENDEHCFLLSYRAFSKDYHAKQETLKGYNTNDLYQNGNLQSFTNDLVSGSDLGLRDCKIVKRRLNDILKSENYDELEYFTLTLDYMIPIALAASFNPDYSYSGKILNKSVDPNVFYEFVNFVIQPTIKGETLILFSCLPEHKKSVKFINELSKLNPLKLQQAISSIIVAYVENTFISPSIWTKLNIFEQTQLINELLATEPITRNLIRKFFHSKLNLLDKRFSKSST